MVKVFVQNENRSWVVADAACSLSVKHGFCGALPPAALSNLHFNRMAIR
jgi:hypothetical protein